VERSAADDDAGIRGTSDVSTALADAPSTSGAHWANRDNENIYRRTGTPFRRPNAVNSFPDDGDEGDEPTEQDEDPTSWWGGTEGMAQHSREPGGRPSWPDQAAADQPSWPELPEPADQQQPRREFVPTPEFGPAPPMNGSRASFGVTAGPIGGYRPGYGPTSAPTSPAARPTSPAVSPVSPAPRSKPLVPPVTGHTGEIFNGPAREIRAHRAMRQNTGGNAALKSPTPPRGTPIQTAAGPQRSRGVTVAAFALGAVVLIGGALGGVAYFSSDNNKGLGSVLELGAGKTDGRTATAPLDGRTTASFEMVAASSQVTVKSQDLGNDLYKITTAADSGMVPSPAVSADRVQLHLTPKGTGTSGDVTIVLSTKVHWSLRFSGGSDEQLIDMTGGKVSEVNLIGGARRVELTLPKPTGTVPVQITGALEELSVTSPPDAPVRVNVEAGAKTIAAGTRTLRDVKPGSTVTPKDWQAADRYDVDAKSWVTLLSVDAKA
jgi:hypothetical protein